MLLGVVCGVLVLAVLALCLRLWLLHRDLDALGRDFAAKVGADTNVGLDCRSADPYVKAMAAQLDRQLKRLRQEHLKYVQGDQELKNAVTGISHDLRTPLTAICGYMELLRQEPASPAVQEYLDVITGRIHAMKALTEELFRYSVVLEGDAYRQRETVSLGDALVQSLVDYYGAFQERGICPEIHMPEEKVQRQLHPQALGRIFSNVISNALKYSDGDFSVSLTSDGVIRFRNHAASLNEVQAGHLFDRFFTVQDGRESTGLGLAIARTLTEELGGTITADWRDGVFQIALAFQ